MIMQKRPLGLFLSLVLACTLAVGLLPQATFAQVAKPTSVGSQYDAAYAPALQKIEDKLEARRKELGIPGMSLVIVRDDKVIYMKGFGYKDFEKQVAVTPDTQFAIGSATK